MALVALTTTLLVTLVQTGASAAVAHKPPKDGCDLVDQKKLDAVLGISTGTPAPQELSGGVACTVPIPYDAATCTVQPEPSVSVGAQKQQGGSQLTLQEAAEQLADGGYEVRPLKGKAYGKKGAFLAAYNGWTFFGEKGGYSVQVQVFEPCGTVPDEKLTAAAQTLAKGAVKQV